MRKTLYLLLFNLICLASAGALATPNGPIIASGIVADEATKARIIFKLRELYGADRVVDQIAIGQVVTPPNWSNHVHALLNPELKSVSRGSLNVDGTHVTLRGEVANEAQRQEIASRVATRLNPNYVVRNQLRVSAGGQSLLDQTLANRIIEFESGSATLTGNGETILRELAAAMRTLNGKRFEIVGHTDSRGERAANVALSQARADAVRTFLAENGIDANLIATSGRGPDEPVAANETAAGRQKNRRIEFRVVQ